MVQLACIWDAEARAIVDLIGINQTFDNASTKAVLGIEFCNMKDSVCEMSETLIETGIIPKP